MSLNAVSIPLDQGIFVWYKDSQIIGIIVSFVDDLLWGGIEMFVSVINSLKKKFDIGSETTSDLAYIGINLRQRNDHSITISQDAYIQNLQTIQLQQIDTSDKLRQLTDHERTLLRKALGQLNWLANISRPEISFTVSEISSRVNSSSVSDLLSVNKAIKFVQTTQGHLTIPNLNLNAISIHVYADASFNNLAEGHSQGGQIVLLTDNSGSCSPISWASNKIKRVVKSTLAAESMSFVEGADSAYFVRQLLSQILKSQPDSYPIKGFTDSKSLFETIGTSHQIADKRLRVEISAIRQMVDNDEIKIEWVTKDQQLSDILTKKGAYPNLLMRVLQKASLTY